MPDLNDELFSSFRTEGSTVNPLPASEVRRRGDRMRRRHNALAAVGGVAAALVVIATPVAIITQQGSDDSGPPIATQTTESPRVSWLQEIPAGLDVTTGLGDETTEVSTSDDAFADQNVCGVGWYFVPQPVDQLSASMINEGSEGGHDRHLVVFADEVQAEAAMAQFTTAPESCDGVYSDEGTQYEMVPVSADTSTADEAAAWVQSGHDESGPTGVGYVTVAQRVGNAVLVDRSDSAGLGDPTVREDGVRNSLDRAQQVIEAMAVFRG